MSLKYGSWRAYQEAAAEVFGELGCGAEFEKTITDSLRTHTVDVYVTFPQFGNDCGWIVGCKLSSKPSSQAGVLTLHGTAQDLAPTIHHVTF